MSRQPPISDGILSPVIVKSEVKEEVKREDLIQYNRLHSRNITHTEDSNEVDWPKLSS